MKSWRTSSTRRGSSARAGAVLAGAAVLIALLSLCLGGIVLPPGTVLDVLAGRTRGAMAGILLYSRLPRTCGCLLAGASLAVSGAVIQSVLNNPLAAPNIIGVNAGAGFAAALCTAFLPANAALTPAASFLGALAGAVAVLTVSERAGASRITLVLAGVAVSSVFSAGIDAVTILFPDALNGYADFRIGGLANVPMTRIAPAFWIALAAFLLVLLLSPELDVLALGTETASSLGLPVKRLRLILLALAAALAGAAVSFCGLLGFVGLIVPHMVRRLNVEESRWMAVLCALGGAAMLTGCDLLSRLAFYPYELPVGILLSLLGGPFFIWLLLRQRGGRTHD